MPVNNPSVTPRGDLLGAYAEYNPADEGFIARDLLPVFGVPEFRGNFGKIPIEARTALIDTKRKPHAAASQSTWESEEDTYALSEYTHEEPIDKTQARIYRTYFQAEEVATKRVRGIIERDLERDVAAAIQNTTTWGLSGTTGLSITNEWDDRDNAVPLDDLNTGIDKMELNGVRPNTLVITSKQVRALSLCAQIEARIGLAHASELRKMTLTAAFLAEHFGLDRVLVAGSIKNNANAGQAYSGARIWSDEYAFLCRTEAGGDLETAQLGRLLEPIDMSGVSVESYWADTKRSFINATMYVQPKIIDPRCGFLFGNAITI